MYLVLPRPSMLPRGDVLLGDAFHHDAILFPRDVHGDMHATSRSPTPGYCDVLRYSLWLLVCDVSVVTHNPILLRGTCCGGYSWWFNTLGVIYVMVLSMFVVDCVSSSTQHVRCWYFQHLVPHVNHVRNFLTQTRFPG